MQSQCTTVSLLHCFTVLLFMWFVFALLSAVFFTLLWVLARMSRGLPSAVVTAMEFLLGPFLLLSVAREIDYPWGETWWQWYLILPFLIAPLMFWALTYALQRTEVTLVKPLFGLSGLTTLFVASLFFGERVSILGVFGILLTVLGIFFLYQGRWEIWKHSGPWIVLAGAVIFGAAGAVIAAVLVRFPHVLALAALAMTASFVVNAVLAGRSWTRVSLNRRTVAILLGLVIAGIGHDLTTLYAFTLGPSPYVIAVKRTSILLTAIVGYVFLGERNQSLQRLLLSAVLVVAGVAFLTLGR